MSKYSKLLTMCKEKMDAVMAPLRAHEMKKKGELELAKLDGTIAEKEQKVQELKSKYPIDYDSIVRAMDDLEITQRRRKQLGLIIKELFE